MSSRRAKKPPKPSAKSSAWRSSTELQDPRVRDVTVTYVEVSADLRHAKVHVSVMGDETRQKLTLAACKTPPASCRRRSPSASTSAIRRG